MTLSPALIGLALLAYVGVLLVIAWVAEAWAKSWLAHPMVRISVYGFSLAIYFTSWTFFGAVGTAASQGWAFLPIFLGPLLLFTVGFPIMRKLVETGRRLQTTSIADFLSTRYGKSEALAGLVAFVCLACALPYIALQLKSIDMGLAALTGVAASGQGSLPAFVVAIGLGVFAILFGTRRLDVSEHNHGMMMAVAVESVVKLAALLFVALFAMGLVAPEQMTAVAERAFAVQQLDIGFGVLTALAFLAFICLPRDFHAMVVECNEPKDLGPARWILIVVFTLTGLAVVPVTLAGLAVLPPASPADQTMIALPLSQGATSVAFIAFLGGFSAATSMVIVASVAVATMISNHLVAPTLLRWQAVPSASMPQLILWTRRSAIMLLILAAYGFQQAVTANFSLGTLGMICFALIAQLGPAMIGGLYWRRGHHSGALAGIVMGVALWFVTLMVPFTLGYPVTGVALAPFGVDLFMLSASASLALNTLVYIGVSRRARETLFDRAQGADVVGAVLASPPVVVSQRWRWGDLEQLMEQFGGAPATGQLRAEAERLSDPMKPRALVPPSVLDMAERQLARLLGAASARILVEHGPHAQLDSHEVANLIGATSEEVRFNRTLMESTFDHMGQAITVFDRDLCLLAWNSQYNALFGFPDGFLQPGRPVDDVLKRLAASGELGDPFAEAQVCAAIEAIRQARPHTYERRQRNDRVLHVSGNPIPGGNYVVTYTDVTAIKRTEQALRDSQDRLEKLNAKLEQRVAERTRELAAAKGQAEAATRSKTRFLAAASHDLMQPINAARLFTSALAGDLEREGHATRGLARKIERSISSADRLLRTLLDISKLDAGGLKAEVVPFALQDLFNELAEEFAVLAGRRGLSLRVVNTRVMIRSDRRLLRSVLQNFLSNAVKYTPAGTILLGARRRGGTIRIDVLDQGPGIPPEHLGQIFREFHRVPGRDVADEPSLGLGLAIVERISTLLQHPVDVACVVAKGSRFSVSVPVAQAGAATAASEPLKRRPADLHGRRVLVIDDDLPTLEGMKLVLESWGAEVDALHWPKGARADIAEPDIVITDYHVARNLTGPTLVERLTQRWSGPVPMIIVSADATDLVRRVARKVGAQLLRKPIDAADLSAALSLLTTRQAAE